MINAYNVPNISMVTLDFIRNNNSTISDNTKFAVLTDGVISYLYTHDLFVSSIYSVYSSSSYIMRSLLRNRSSELVYRLGVGSVCSTLKYIPIKSFLDFGYLENNLNNAYFKTAVFLVGTLNNAAYESIIFFHEATTLKISLPAYWYIMPYTIESYEDLLKHYFTNSMMKNYEYDFQELGSSWEKNAIRSFSIGSHLYSGLANVYYAPYNDIYQCFYENSIKSIFFNIPFIITEKPYNIHTSIVMESVYLGNCFLKEYEKISVVAYDEITDIILDNNATIIFNNIQDDGSQYEL